MPAGDKVTFSGVDWNNIVDPGASVSFGYCAEL
jgi:cellulase/cellobiase CelA1